MHKYDSAISVQCVSKTYRLYASLKEQALDVLGLSKLRFWRTPLYEEYPALFDISFEVKKGERVAIVGRNGAGKTTLLKLITGNFAPSSGMITVNGRVQALMNIGLGFHPEFTGYENARSSLAYNGLSREDLSNAMDDVINFVELGEFLNQPVKTYSLGMQARLMFATSTAIKPEILIIDEILGAGDAYFSAKSSSRMDRLTKSGCTLLLVSHSMQQALQFCERAIWLEQGKIVMDGDALSVVKAYEEYTQKLEWEASRASNENKSILSDPELKKRILVNVLKQEENMAIQNNGDDSNANAVRLSRWAGETGLKIRDIKIFDQKKNPAVLVRTGEPIEILIDIEAEQAGNYPCTIVVVLFTEDGKVLSRHCSSEQKINLRENESTSFSLCYEPILLGNGIYLFSAALYKNLDLTRLHEAKYYDLLSRSFKFKVIDELRDDPSLFHPPVKWIDNRKGMETC